MLHGVARAKWVYGYRGFDTRGAALWSGTGRQVIYPAAAVVVVYDAERHTQRFFRRRTDGSRTLHAASSFPHATPAPSTLTHTSPRLPLSSLQAH